MQPTSVQNNNTHFTFGRVNYCQGFFSSGIWMAISASVILTFILAFGVSLLFNVKALDRFDDPKGKPLNIGAEK
jgi:V-type H+-transporting ATPase S1 subunit